MRGRPGLLGRLQAVRAASSAAAAASCSDAAAASRAGSTAWPARDRAPPRVGRLLRDAAGALLGLGELLRRGLDAGTRLGGGFGRPVRFRLRRAHRFAPLRPRLLAAVFAPSRHGPLGLDETRILGRRAEPRPHRRRG